MTAIPSATAQVWKDLVTGKTQPQFEFIAAKLRLGAICVKVKKDSSPDSIAVAVSEIRDLFVTNSKLPKVQRDLAKIT